MSEAPLKVTEAVILKWLAGVAIFGVCILGIYEGGTARTAGIAVVTLSLVAFVSYVAGAARTTITTAKELEANRGKTWDFIDSTGSTNSPPDHPELEHKPWALPDTWVPPERPIQ